MIGADSQDILMVDDELDIVECIKLLLQRLELDASGFTDPLLALEYFKKIIVTASVWI
jgi:DNA-binding response OmpR family regulator